MIGSGLKKLAQENGMKIAKGVAYGSLRGFAATFSEGSGYKMMVLATKFTDPAMRNELQLQINGRNITRDFRVRNLDFAPDGIRIVFNDTIGTMKKIREFIDWFFPMLAVSSATTADICSECGTQMTAGTWKLVNGTAFCMHEGCARKMAEAVAESEQAERDADPGNYFTGLLGALIGALLGAVVWAIVLNMGYVASLVGLLIGWLAEKGYNLLRGKQDKGKVLILAVSVVAGVVCGTFAADAITLMQMVAEGSTYLTYGDIPEAIIMLLEESEEYRSAVISNLLQGMLFAGIGVVALLFQANKAVSGTKIQNLE